MRSLEKKQLIEILSALAVVSSLVFVGLELRQSNNIATRDARAELIGQVVEIERLAIENPSHAGLLVKLASKDQMLAADEYEQARALAQLLVSLWASVGSAQDSGFLPDEVFESYSRDIVSRFRRYPGLGPIVKQRLEDWGLGPEFSEIYARIYDQIERAEVGRR